MKIISRIKELHDNINLVFGDLGGCVIIFFVVVGSMVIFGLYYPTLFSTTDVENFGFYDPTLLSATDVEKLDLSGCEAQELKKILLLRRTPLNNADVREARFLCHRATAENEHNRLLDDLLFQQNKALGDR